MKCAIGTVGIDTTATGDEYEKLLSELGQTGGGVIEIKQKGCLPVNIDTCKSGYMAPIENITFPNNAAAATCCKCKSGERCEYCIDAENCTEDEAAQYVTTATQCFGEKPITINKIKEIELRPEDEKASTPFDWKILIIVTLVIGTALAYYYSLHVRVNTVT